jgi:L-ascorbate metabolism protein UlaG (beta-lactamase superfamily)
MKIRHIRHATMMIEFRGQRFLLDPMLSPAGSMPPVAGVADLSKNPLVDLPVDPASLVSADALIITHLHTDHLDQAALELLPRDLITICQPEDQPSLISLGFTNLVAIDEPVVWADIRIIRVGGQHGTGKIGMKMGPVAGFVLQAADEPTLYITGDTIWCPEVAAAIDMYAPAVMISYAGCARFGVGDPITMGPADVLAMVRKAPAALVIAVHMEAWNHCSLTRNELRQFLEQHGINQQVFIPADGEELELPG